MPTTDIKIAVLNIVGTLLIALSLLWLLVAAIENDEESKDPTHTLVIKHGPLEVVKSDVGYPPRSHYSCGCEQVCARDCWTDDK